MTTIASDPQIALREPASLPALRIADQGVASALESLLFGSTRRVYGVQWRLFNDWCDLVGLRALPAVPLTVARYLAAPRRLRRHHRHPAPGHLRHRQGP